MAHVYGYLSDPSTRIESDGSVTNLRNLDRKYGKLPAKTAGDVDLSSYCVVMDQFELSACVGNSTAESVEILNNIAGYKPVPVSRLFIYNAAREKNGNLDQDAGTYIRSAFEVLSTLGVCDEYLWPYQNDLVFKSPSVKAQRQAVGHRIHTYYRIDATGNDRLDEIVSALRANHPVVFGTQVDTAFENCNSDTPLHAPTGNTLGGHAMCIVGYFADKGFLVKNSWGTSWGAGGFCIMAPDYLTSDQTDDIWVPTLGIDLS